MAPRREFLTACGAPALAAPPVAAAEFAADDPHHAWRLEERRIHDAMTAAFAAGDEKLANRLNGERWEYRNRIIETSATTPQGLGLRVRLIAEMEEEGLTLGPDCFAALRSVADDLDRMGRRA